MNRLDRVSALLIMLQLRSVVRAHDMAERYGVSVRTIYRDMRTLTEAGVPLCGDAGVGYSLVEGYRLPALMFTKEEALAFLMAEKMIEKLTDSANTNYFRGGMDKIRSALRTVDKHYLEDMDARIAVYKSRTTDNTQHDLLHILLRSINEQRCAHMVYTNATGQESERQIEAVGISYSYPHWYLMAWCHLRGEYRMFRLDRIHKATILDRAFVGTHPPLESLLGNDRPHSLHKVVLTTTKQAAKRHADGCHFMGLIAEQDLDNNRVQQTFMTYSLDTMARWVLSHADTTKAIEPPELKQIIKQIISNLEL